MHTITGTIIFLLVLFGGLAFISANKTLPRLQQQKGVISPTPLPSGDKGTQSGISLSVEYPANGSTVHVASIVIRGKTAANASVFVNENELKADRNGNFFTTIQLEEGDNSFIIVANDDQGNHIEQEIMVTYEP